MTILDYYYKMAQTLRTGEQVREMAWLFRATLYNIDVNSWPITEISENDALYILKGIERLLQDEPIAYILGTTEFFWCSISVNPSVLIPRPETERLCELVAKRVHGNSKVLDLCTGSGCIAVALKKSNPDLCVDASDISRKALKTVTTNAKRNKVEIHTIESDMWQNISDKYDAIVSNPPYLGKTEMENLPRSVADYEPHLALFGGDDGLDFYRNIADNAPQFLTESGRLFLEVGDEQACKVASLLEKNFTDIEIIKDYFDKERYVFARRK